jgi:hypothetical protein
MQAPAVLVHEITGGMGLRRLSTGEPATWLALCDPCHKTIHGEPKTWTKSRQLAYKIKRDPDNFDLERVNHILSGGKGHPVDLSDIAEYLSAI